MAANDERTTTNENGQNSVAVDDCNIKPGVVLYPRPGPPLRVAGVAGRYSDDIDTVVVGFGTDLRWFIDDSGAGLKVFDSPHDLADALWKVGHPGRWNLEVLHALGWLTPNTGALARARDAAGQS